MAGLLVGLASAAAVLGADLLSGALVQGSGHHPLADRRAQDLRLAADANRAPGHRAARTSRSIEIDEYSLRNLQPNAGRWPWPRVVHAMLHRLPGARAGEADRLRRELRRGRTPARGFEFGGDTMSGAESDQALVDSVKAAGNVILLADATYNAESGDERPRLPDTGFRSDAPGVVERARGLSAVSGAGRRRPRARPQLVRPRSRRPAAAHGAVRAHRGDHVLPSLGLAAALAAAGIAPRQVRFDGDRLCDRRSRDAAAMAPRAGAPMAPSSYQWGLIDFRGPALLADLKSAPIRRYSFFDLVALGAADPQRPQAGTSIPSLFSDKIVFVGTTASGLFDVFETPFCRRQDAGHQHPRGGRRRHAVEPLHPRGVAVASASRPSLAIGAARRRASRRSLPAWWATAATVAVHRRSSRGSRRGCSPAATG